MTGVVPVGAGCNQFPATPAVPFRPAYFTDGATTGWDGGAHSNLQLSGDVRLAFTANESVAVVCGLTAAATAASVAPERVAHGFYVTRIAGVLTARVWESGRIVAGPWNVEPGDLLEVLRAGSRVIYRRAGAVVYRSRTPSTGTVKVAASLYGPEDFVG